MSIMVPTSLDCGTYVEDPAQDLEHIYDKKIVVVDDNDGKRILNRVIFSTYSSLALVKLSVSYSNKAQMTHFYITNKYR